MAEEAIEDYLKQIYEISLDESPVKTSVLAEAMALSPASVSEMLKKLATHKLVEYKPYYGAKLTDEGRKKALTVVRRHRLWETFLHRILGIPWQEIHEHACKLEHATTDELADRVDEYLAHPDTDPHGDPIPGRDGTVTEVQRLRLSSLKPGDRAEVLQCANENTELLAYLKELGLVPGQHIKVGSQAPFNGPLTVETEKDTCVIGMEVARTIIVQIVS